MKELGNSYKEIVDRALYWTNVNECWSHIESQVTEDIRRQVSRRTNHEVENFIWDSMFNQVCNQIKSPS